MLCAASPRSNVRCTARPRHAPHLTCLHCPGDAAPSDASTTADAKARLESDGSCLASAALRVYPPLRPLHCAAAGVPSPGARSRAVLLTERGCEPLRAEPNKFPVPHLGRRGSSRLGPAAHRQPCRAPGSACKTGPAATLAPCSRLCDRSGRTCVSSVIDSEGIRAPAGRAQWISSPSP